MFSLGWGGEDALRAPTGTLSYVVESQSRSMDGGPGFEHAYTERWAKRVGVGPVMRLHMWLKGAGTWPARLRGHVRTMLAKGHR